jgi:Uma2 family endonuclease
MTVEVEELKAELKSDGSHFVIDGVSWETYESLLHDFAVSGQRKRVTYNEGRMVIVSPLFKHERWKKLLGRIVEAVTDELDIAIVSAGSTTWKRKRKKKGLEPDECFYIQNERVMRGRLEVDLKRDPPPDLAIEVDLRPYLLNKVEVYAGLGIPEVWCFDGLDVEIFSLQPNGKYETVERSVALKMLTPAELKRFLDLLSETDEHSVLREARKCVRKRKR